MYHTAGARFVTVFTRDRSARPLAAAVTVSFTCCSSILTSLSTTHMETVAATREVRAQTNFDGVVLMVCLLHPGAGHGLYKY